LKAFHIRVGSFLLWAVVAARVFALVAKLLFFRPSSAGTVAISLPLGGVVFLGVTDFLLFLLD